ncbi:MAG: hypothetical protein ACI9VR_003202 [Cognaticolwellia sp.]
MSFLDDLIAKARGKGQDAATEAAAKAAAAATAAAMEKTAHEMVDDLEKHLVGDLKEVQAQDAALEKRALERQTANEANRAQVHKTRMERKSKAEVELAALKAAMNKA